MSTFVQSAVDAVVSFCVPRRQANELPHSSRGLATRSVYALEKRNHQLRTRLSYQLIKQTDKKHTSTIFFHYFYFDMFCRGRVLNASLKGQVINQGVWQNMNIYLGSVVLKN